MRFASSRPQAGPGPGWAMWIAAVHWGAFLALLTLHASPSEGVLVSPALSPATSRRRLSQCEGEGWNGDNKQLDLFTAPASMILLRHSVVRQSLHYARPGFTISMPPRLRTTGLQATAKPAASQEGKRRLTPAEELQYATTPEDILSLAARHAGASLKPSHLSQAVLRIGRGLVQPRDAGRRRALREDERLTQVLSAWEAKVGASPNSAKVGESPNSANSATPRHYADLLLGLALLDYPVTDETVGRMMAVFENVFQEGGEEGAGLKLKLKSKLKLLSGEDVSNVGWALQRLGKPLDLLPPKMREAIEGLPFKVLLGALLEHEPDVHEIMNEVEFRKDMMQIAGKEVEETRLTAWQGPQPFYYSGKEMAPSPMTPAVASIRDALFQKTGWYFDCVLLNLYANGRVGMNYHIDPDQGVLWTEKTAVVSVGDSRYFCVRRIEDHKDRHRFLVSGGDVVLMFGDCQKVYQHCVRKEEAEDEAGPRISLVFKESLHRKEERQQP